MNKKLLTFEIAKEKELLEIHVDKEGLREFILILQNMIVQEAPAHAHLMTPSWGGEEICEEKQGENNELLHHVKILFWK